MPDEAGPAQAPLSVRGLHRGAELAGQGALELGEREMVLAMSGRSGSRPRRIVVAYDAIDGVRVDGDHLTVFLGTGDLLELAGAPSVDALAQELAARVCAFPELTLRLRALGSGRAHPGSDHDRFFGPLLAARRLLAERRFPLAQAEAFAAAPLQAAYARTLAGFASERFPQSPADRRALEAELDELAEPLMASLEALATAADEVRTSAEDVRFARWRTWAAAVQRTFDEADRCWIAALPLMCDSRGQEGRFWHRALKLRALIGVVHP